MRAGLKVNINPLLIGLNSFIDGVGVQVSHPHPLTQKRNSRYLLRLDRQHTGAANLAVLRRRDRIALDGHGRRVRRGIPREHLAVAVCNLQPRLDIDVAIP